MVRKKNKAVQKTLEKQLKKLQKERAEQEKIKRLKSEIRDIKFSGLKKIGGSVTRALVTTGKGAIKAGAKIGQNLREEEIQRKSIQSVRRKRTKGAKKVRERVRRSDDVLDFIKNL